MKNVLAETVERVTKVKRVTEVKRANRVLVHLGCILGHFSGQSEKA